MLISSIEGNYQHLDGGSMFGNAPKPLWEKWFPADNLNRINLACRALLIETADSKILLETGVGDFLEPKLAERYGIAPIGEHSLLENLKKLGVDPQEIDVVILSHLHFDHAGGLLPSYSISRSKEEHGGELLFPKAKYIVGEEAFKRAVNPHLRDRASFIEGLQEKLFKSQRLSFIDKSGLYSQNLLDGRISFHFTQGHTVGQMHTLLRGEKQSLFFCGDLIPGIPWVHAPITMGYDRAAETMVDEKMIFLEHAVKEEWILFYTHDPIYAVSKCAKDDKGKFIATQMQEQLLRYRL
ncbi:MAG: MBL fold metallo-hydrolase [Oligoflexia bacterium]|nr:MBL fold metallo-hydrolase [Oligoflexia bacterium]MBF0366030.1 MBL fold metallo-hydrolase [Oligoflexia bacterium]